MTGKADRRRPLAVAVALVAAIGAVLVAPVLIDTRQGGPVSGSMVRADSRDAVTITAPLALFASPALTLEQGTVSLAGGGADQSRVGAVLRALVSGGGVDLVIDGARLTLDRSAAPDAPGAPAESAGAVPETRSVPEALGPIVSTLAGFSFRSLTLADATLVILTPQGGRETLSHIDAAVTTGRDGLVAAKGRLEWRGEPLDFDVAFTSPAHLNAKADAAADTPVSVRASVKGAYLTATLNGRIAPGDRRQITAENAELSISDVRRAASWLGAQWPAGPGLGPFTAKGTLTLDERSVSFEQAQFTLDGNAATGALRAALGAERPSIEGTLAFASFDLAPYAAPSRPYALALAVDWLSGIRIPGLASPSLLREIDADLRISAGSVTSGSERLGRSAASLSIKDGKLNGELAELELEQGGSGEGQFTADMSGAEPRYTLRAKLDDIDMAKVVSPRLGPTALDGIGDLTLDISAHGMSEDDLLGSLSGALALEMREGGRLGLDLDALPQAAGAAAAAEGWGPVAAGTTAVNGLAARFTAAGGILTADGVEARMEDRTVNVTGTIDIDKTDIDLVLSITGAPDAAPDPARPAGAFKLRGPWSAPAISPAEPGKAARGTVSGADPG